MEAGVSTLPWQGRTAFVTGGTGFIGNALAHRLAELGASVIVPTRDRLRIARNDHPHIRYILAPSGDGMKMAELMAGVSTVFNLAYDFRRSAKDNIALYEIIADACASARVQMLVQASSVAVYDGWPAENIDELSPCDGSGHEYKIGKRAIERDIVRRVEAGAFDAVILQPTIVYGPGSPQWVDALVERMAGGALILAENDDGLCNGVFIDDVVEAFVAAAALKRGGAERFIVSGPQPFLWSALFAAYAQACGAAVRYEAPAVNVPEPSVKRGNATAMFSAPIRQAAAAAAGLIGSRRIERLRARIMRMKPGERIYRPIAENPRLFRARGVASVDKMRAQLCTSTIGAQEGLDRTQDYIRTRYSTRE